MDSGLRSAGEGDPRSPRRVLLGDMHPLFRSGMSYLLQDELDPVEVVEVGSRNETLASLEGESFDLVLTSLYSAEGDWDPFLRELLQRGPADRLMILSGISDPTSVCRILLAGAAGYLLKATHPDIIRHAIRLVLAGGTYVPPAALGVLSQGAIPNADTVAPVAGVPLNDRQRSVLNLLIQGASNKGIARSLDLSAGTVKAQVATLLRLYGAENRTELVHAATRGGSVVARGSSSSESRRIG
jgi:DNA-binding NarL/FixJ family response regulator